MAALLNTEKKPLTALMLSVGMPGLGQIYLAQGELGLLLYLIPNLVVVLCFLFTNAVGVLSGLLVLFIFYFYSCLKAWFDATRGRYPEASRPYNHPLIYLLLWCLHLAFTLWLTDPFSSLGRHTVVRAFRAGSAAMAPALLEGDLFFARPTQPGDAPLKPGDVVVVREPTLSGHFQIRRVIAGPGDVLWFGPERFLLNETQVIQEPYSRSGINPVVHHKLGEVNFLVTEHQGRRAGHGSYPIPEHHYYLLADHRFKYTDSILWGPVSGDRIVGKVELLLKTSGSWSRLGRFSPNYKGMNDRAP